jgi:hypothetical protein
MKKIVSALAVLAVVGGAFAFKPLSQGKIYCNTSGTPSPVCIDPGNTGENRIAYQESTNVNDPSNPCGSGKVEYIKSGTDCVLSTATHFKSVIAGN